MACLLKICCLQSLLRHFLTNTLLAQVANHVLFHLSGTNTSTLNDESPLKDVEYKSLQYLTGFVIRKLYSSFRYNKEKK